MTTPRSAIALVAITAILGQLATACDSGVSNLSASPAGRDANLLASQDIAKQEARSQVDFDQADAEPLETSGERYNPISENPFLRAANHPLSTFAIDVDAASYSNVRRFINEGQLPPQDAVRIEELINYFKYDYPQPEGDRPFSIITEVATAPWNPAHRLVHIGMQGKTIANENLPPSNLVFLLDVSGSMDEPNKLPLLKSAFRLLVDQLREQDRVSIVVYAGSAGVVLPSTPGNQRSQILEALEQLEAGGSTAGGEGIQRAYQLAQENFIESGNNRVILATDGDFNVGISSDADLVRLIEEKREQGVFLTVLGFGTGNLQDAKMESLANQGNGHYAYIDNILEAKKVLVSELGGTLLTIAKDVKIQVAFNPAQVQAYRLIGYENRRLRSEDFSDDTKDAGELGAGHSVTALYEVIPTGVESDVELSEIDASRPRQNGDEPIDYPNDELMQVQLRYKAPDHNNSQLLTYALIDQGLELEEASTDFKFSSAVAAFGMVLRGSQHKGNASFDQVLSWASDSQGPDLDGYRAEFIRLVQSSKKIMGNQAKVTR